MCLGGRNRYIFINPFLGVQHDDAEQHCGGTFLFQEELPVSSKLYAHVYEGEHEHAEVLNFHNQM